jgi:uroporphyrinogen-III synthase
MRILLTRARADAERTAARLAARGHETVISPVIAIVATGSVLPGVFFDAMIATSRHAFASSHTDALRDVPLYAVGERTREAAQRAGWIGPIHVGENAQALIALLRTGPQDLRRVLYLAGRDRKPDIEDASQAMGLALDIVETYAAREIAAFSEEAERALRNGEVDAVLHYSRRSAELFVARVEQAGLRMQAADLRHFALSADAAEPLTTAGLQTSIAARPDEDHLFARLNEPPRERLRP